MGSPLAQLADALNLRGPHFLKAFGIDAFVFGLRTNTRRGRGKLSREHSQNKCENVYFFYSFFLLYGLVGNKNV